MFCIDVKREENLYQYQICIIAETVQCKGRKEKKEGEKNAKSQHGQKLTNTTAACQLLG